MDLHIFLATYWLLPFKTVMLIINIYVCIIYVDLMLLVIALVLWGWAGYPAVPDYPARYPTLSGKKKPDIGKVCRIIRPNIWHLARKTRSGPTLVSSYTECNINFLILIHFNLLLHMPFLNLYC